MGPIQKFGRYIGAGMAWAEQHRITRMDRKGALGNLPTAIMGGIIAEMFVLYGYLTIKSQVEAKITDGNITGGDVLLWRGGLSLFALISFAVVGYLAVRAGAGGKGK